MLSKETGNGFEYYCQDFLENGIFNGIKAELHFIHGPQTNVVVADKNKNTLINFCSNNYTGLAADQRIIDAAK